MTCTRRDNDVRRASVHPAFETTNTGSDKDVRRGSVHPEFEITNTGSDKDVPQVSVHPAFEITELSAAGIVESVADMSERRHVPEPTVNREVRELGVGETVAEGGPETHEPTDAAGDLGEPTAEWARISDAAGDPTEVDPSPEPEGKAEEVRGAESVGIAGIGAAPEHPELPDLIANHEPGGLNSAEVVENASAIGPEMQKATEAVGDLGEPTAEWAQVFEAAREHLIGKPRELIKAGIEAFARSKDEHNRRKEADKICILAANILAQEITAANMRQEFRDALAHWRIAQSEKAPPTDSTSKHRRGPIEWIIDTIKDLVKEVLKELEKEAVKALLLPGVHLVLRPT